MKAYIFIYLAIAGMMSVADSYTPQVLGAGEARYETYGEEREELQQNIESAEVQSETSILAMVNNFISTIKQMATFSFSITGAPPPLNATLSGIFGIMTVGFILALIREVVRLVPFI